MRCSPTGIAEIIAAMPGPPTVELTLVMLVLLLVLGGGTVDGGGTRTGAGTRAGGLGAGLELAGGGAPPLLLPPLGAAASGGAWGRGTGDGGCSCACTGACITAGGGGGGARGAGTLAGGGTGTMALGAVFGESADIGPGAGCRRGLFGSPRSGVGPSPARFGVPTEVANGARRRLCGARTGNHGAAPPVTL